MITDTHPHPTIVLVPGHWLGGWAFDDVVPPLRAHGLRVSAVTLPGLEPGASAKDRARIGVGEQAAALTEVVGSSAAPVVLVVHSGASYPASVLLDADPGAVSRIVYVDSGPAADSATFAADLPADIDELELPPFEVLGQRASLDGIDEQGLARFRKRAVPEPGGVLRERLRLGNDARRDVPSTIIACSFPSQVMLSMARDGHR